MSKKDANYPQLDQLFGAYLNQDFSYWGNTIAEVVRCYKRDHPREDHLEMLAEIEQFEQTHREDMDAAFESAYGFDFCPRLWGHTAASFLTELRSLLKRP